MASVVVVVAHGPDVIHAHRHHGILAGEHGAEAPGGQHLMPRAAEVAVLRGALQRRRAPRGRAGVLKDLLRGAARARDIDYKGAVRSKTLHLKILT